MELIHLSHCVYQCDYHVVLVTKYRRAILNEGILAYISKKLMEITEHYPMIRFKTVNHDKDHIHYLVSIPPTMTVGTVIGIVKQKYLTRDEAKIPVLEKGVLGNGFCMVRRVFRINGGD